jgi:hypothetical protein
MPTWKKRKDRRTRVSLRDDLHLQLKGLALVRRTTLAETIDEVVAYYLLEILPKLNHEED